MLAEKPAVQRIKDGKFCKATPQREVPKATPQQGQRPGLGKEEASVAGA